MAGPRQSAFALDVIADGMSKGREPPGPAGPKTRPRKGERAFDQWLNRGLHELYDEVVREPIPPELLQLIEQDRKK